jgi:transposase
MKKISTVAAKQIRDISERKLTIGLDLGERSSWYCVLNETGEVLLVQKVGTTPKAMREVFGVHGAVPDGAGDGHALALGQSVVE